MVNTRTVHHKLRYLNIFSAVVAAVLAELGVESLLEEICFWETALRLKCLLPPSVHSHSFVLVFEDVGSWFLFLASASTVYCHTFCLTMMGSFAWDHELK